MKTFCELHLDTKNRFAGRLCKQDFFGIQVSMCNLMSPSCCPFTKCFEWNVKAFFIFSEVLTCMYAHTVVILENGVSKFFSCGT